MHAELTDKEKYIVKRLDAIHIEFSKLCIATATSLTHSQKIA